MARKRKVDPAYISSAARLRALADMLERGEILAAAAVAIPKDAARMAETALCDHPPTRLALIGGIAQLQHLVSVAEAQPRIAQLARRIDPASMQGDV